MEGTFIAKNPSVLWFLLGLSVFTVLVTIFSEAAGSSVVSTSFLKTLGKTPPPFFAASAVMWSPMILKNGLESVGGV